MNISILNYNACNLASVYNAFYNLGADVKIINKKDRKHAGPSVPAHGLYLQNVLYETDVYI